MTPQDENIIGSPTGKAEMGEIRYPTPEKLTPREKEVLNLIADGNTTKQIATALGITFKTVACHRTSLIQKFGVHESVSLVRSAIRNGIIEP